MTLRRYPEPLLIVVQVDPDGPWYRGQARWWRTCPDGTWQVDVEYRRVVKRRGWEAIYSAWFPAEQARLWPLECRRWHPIDPPRELCGAYIGTGTCTACSDGSAFEPPTRP